MRKCVAIILLVLLGTYFHGAAVLWSSYYIFADQIAAAFCENPASEQCHGKCHIRKVAEQNDHSNNPILIVDRTPESAPLPDSTFQCYAVENNSEYRLTLSVGNPLPGYTDEIHQPPILSV